MCTKTVWICFGGIVETQLNSQHALLRSWISKLIFLICKLQNKVAVSFFMLQLCRKAEERNIYEILQMFFRWIFRMISKVCNLCINRVERNIEKNIQCDANVNTKTFRNNIVSCSAISHFWCTIIYPLSYDKHHSPFDIKQLIK